MGKLQPESGTGTTVSPHWGGWPLGVVNCGAGSTLVWETGALQLEAAPFEMDCVAFLVLVKLNLIPSHGTLPTY